MNKRQYSLEYNTKFGKMAICSDSKEALEDIRTGKHCYDGKNTGNCARCGVYYDKDNDNYCWNCGVPLTEQVHRLC